MLRPPPADLSPPGASISFFGSFASLRLREVMLSKAASLGRSRASVRPVLGQCRACSRETNDSNSQGHGRKMLRPPRDVDLPCELGVSISFLGSFALLWLRELMLNRAANLDLSRSSVGLVSSHSLV